MRTKSGFKSIFLICTVILVAAGSFGSVQAQGGGTRIADGLNGPMGVLVTPNGIVWVVDSGTGGDEERESINPATRQPATLRIGDTSKIQKIGPDGSRTVIATLPSFMYDPLNTYGGARLAVLDGELYATSSAWSENSPPERSPLAASVVRIAEGERTEVANTWDIERDENPDGMNRASNPYGLTAGPDGKLWVADAAANTLLKVDPESGAVEVAAVFDGLASPVPSASRDGARETDAVPTAVAFDDQGNAYVSLLPGFPMLPDSGKVVKVTPEGEIQKFADLLTTPVDLRRGPDGELYAVSFGRFTEQGPVPNSGAVVRIHEGSGSEEVVTGLAFPTSVDFNAGGDAFVTTNGAGAPGTGEVWKFGGVAVAASSPDSLPDIVNRWMSVHQGSFDIDGYLALFTEDVVFRDGETGLVAQGRFALAEAVRPFTQLSDLSPHVMRQATNGNQVFVEGELTAKTPTGESVTSRGVVIFTMEDSKIASLTTYLFRENVSLEKRPAEANRENPNAREEAEIRARIGGYLNAWNAGDAEALASYYDENGDRFNNSGDAFRGRSAIREHYERVFSAPPPKGIVRQLLYHDIDVRIVSTDAAVVDVMYEVSGVRANVDFTTRGRNTVFMIKRDSQWMRVAHRNSLKISPDCLKLCIENGFMPDR